MPRYGYARVSTNDQDAALQRTALKQAGVEHIVEEKQSGAKDDRPKLNELLSKLRPGDELVVWKLDRLGRNFHHLYDTVMDLEQRGIKFISLRENIDTATAMGRLFFILLAAFAEFEREVIRERILAGLAEAKSKGAILGSRLYGFQLGSNEAVEHEAALLQALAKWVLEGGALRTLATNLNSKGIPTNRGARWTATTIRRTLAHDRMVEILGHEQHAAVLKKLNIRTERQGRPAAHLLSGFVFCDCGTPMYGAKNQRGALIYKCKKGLARYPNTCGRLSIVAAPLEEHVTEKVWERWEVWQEVTEDDTAEVSAQIADLEAKLADLAAQVRAGLSLEFALPLEAGWREDLAAARQLRDRGLQVVGYMQIPPFETAQHIEASWASWSIAERRELLRALGLRVVVRRSPAHRTFDPDRVWVRFSAKP